MFDRILCWIVWILVIVCIATTSFAEDRLAWGTMMMCGNGEVGEISCNTSTDYVGNHVADPSGWGGDAGAADRIDCWSATATCGSGCTTGTLGRAFGYSWSPNGYGTDKVAVYTKTSSAPAAADALVGASAAFTTKLNDWNNSTDIGGTVTCGTTYWICTLEGATPTGAWQYKNQASAGVTLYYKVVEGSYATPPSNLETGFSTANNYGPKAFWIEIK